MSALLGWEKVPHSLVGNLSPSFTCDHMQSKQQAGGFTHEQVPGEVNCSTLGLGSAGATNEPFGTTRTQTALR